MTDRMLQFLDNQQLPPRLQAVSKPFDDLARQIVETLPANAERTAGMRKLLEAKDCAIRATLQGADMISEPKDMLAILIYTWLLCCGLPLLLAEWLYRDAMAAEARAEAILAQCHDYIRTIDEAKALAEYGAHDEAVDLLVALNGRLAKGEPT